MDSFLTLILRVLQVAQAMLGFPVFTILATLLSVRQLRVSKDCLVWLTQLPLECQTREFAANFISFRLVLGDSNYLGQK